MEKRDSDQNKPPKRSFLYYYGIVMLVLLLLNIFVFPSVMDKTVEGRYDEFLTSLNAGEVDEVYVTTNDEVMYTLKGDSRGAVHKTGLMPGDNITERLAGTDARFSSEIQTQASPLLDFLLTWIAPFVILVLMGAANPDVCGHRPDPQQKHGETDGRHGKCHDLRKVQCQNLRGV